MIADLAGVLKTSSGSKRRQGAGVPYCGVHFILSVRIQYNVMIVGNKFMLPTAGYALWLGVLGHRGSQLTDEVSLPFLF
jgi:hypothetical protein